MRSQNLNKLSLQTQIRRMNSLFTIANYIIPVLKDVWTV